VRNKSIVQRIGAFITPHGFGHATRAIAVLEALQRHLPYLGIDICTTVSKCLFTESLANVTIHSVVPDIGLVQLSALAIDLPATAAALDEMLPFGEETVDRLAQSLKNCSCILSDIAPLGILVAERAGIPSILVENFTWDWIYRSYIAECPELEHHARDLASIYSRATLHIQTEPVCNPIPGTETCPPIFRKTRTAPEAIRKIIGAGTRKIVIVSLGGIDFALPGWQQLDRMTDCFFVLAGQQENRLITQNCLTISRQSELYHPDLIGAADLVVFKSGYSTAAECLQAGTRAVCITRPTFAESRVLDHYIRENLEGTLLDEDTFLAGTWIDHLPEMLARPRPQPATFNGADCIAELLLPLICR